MNLLLGLLEILLGYSAGVVVSGGVVAFISIIGIIPIMTYRTKTSFAALWYENAIVLGSVLGSIFYIWEPPLPNWPLVAVLLLFCFGIFIGVLIIALAEVLDILPIINRRIHIRKGITLIMIALALGKLVGSLCYWLSPYFITIISQ